MDLAMPLQIRGRPAVTLGACSCQDLARAVEALA